MTQTAHTPTPWKATKEIIREVNATQFGDIAICWGGYGEANAAFIVKACNAHDELVKQLTILRDKCKLYGGPNGGKMDLSGANAILAKVQS